MKRFMWGYLTFICVGMAFAGISASLTDKAFSSFFIGIVFLLLAVLCFKKFRSPGKRLLPESRTYLPGSPLPVVNSGGLILSRGEICHLAEKVSVGKTKTVTTRTVSSHSGGSVRIAKGLSVRSGTSSSRSIRENILDTVAGSFYVTNQRVVASSSKYNFDKPLSALSSYTMYLDGFALQFGKDTFTILTKEPIYLMNITLAAISENT